MSLPATPSQTVGPFFTIGLAWLNRDNLAGPGIRGERMTIAGRVLDGDGEPVPDALIEIWQADRHGRYAHAADKRDEPAEAGFTGYGRIPTDEKGSFRFTTIKPGRVPGPNGKPQAPHLIVSVFARGLLRRLITRIYFPDEPDNAEDFALNLVEPSRRSTLIARKTDEQGRMLAWDVILQGLEETVFFDC